jgi:hypothetical protein
MANAKSKNRKGSTELTEAGRRHYMSLLSASQLPSNELLKLIEGHTQGHPLKRSPIHGSGATHASAALPLRQAPRRQAHDPPIRTSAHPTAWIRGGQD